MKKLKASKGFITAASTLMLAGVALTGFYITETIVKQESLKSINEASLSTAKKLNKVQLALQTYVNINHNINPADANISCNTLVQAHLITSKDCQDTYGNPITITNNNGNLQIGLNLQRAPHASIFRHGEGKGKAIYQADILQHLVAIANNNNNPQNWNQDSQNNSTNNNNSNNNNYGNNNYGNNNGNGWHQWKPEIYHWRPGIIQ